MGKLDILMESRSVIQQKSDGGRVTTLHARAAIHTSLAAGTRCHHHSPAKPGVKKSHSRRHISAEFIRSAVPFSGFV